MVDKKELTKEEKINLLKVFINDETCFRAITETLSQVELENYIDKNIDTLLQTKQLEQDLF